MVSGLPVRAEFLHTTRAEGIEYFHLDPNKPVILASGGSRGAKSINRAMILAYKTLLAESDVQIIHATGRDGFEETKKMLLDIGIDLHKYADRVRLEPYLEHMEYALAAADVVVARAGATNLAEICACAKPAILVPYPFASENHQEYNARVLVEQNAAVMILDRDLQGEALAQDILKIIADDDLKKQMSLNSEKIAKRESLEKIVDFLEQYLT